MHRLRDYQEELIAEIEAAIAQGYRRIMLQLPTGAGKTRCFVELAKRHRARPYVGNIPNCLIVAHRQELIAQAALALRREGIREWEIGIIKAGERANQHRGIQIASIQSLVRRDFPLAGLVIIDEAHHAIADTYQKVIHHPHYEDAVILGVTATPERTDGRGFRDSFDILIKGPTVKELTVQRYLCPYKLYAYTRDRINTSYVRTQAGDYQLNQLAEAVMDSEVRADLVKTWQKQALGKRTVVFAVNVQLSREYAALYNASSGYKAEHIDGKTHKDEREAILKRFKNGTTTILCNCNIVTEGFDLAEMECVQIVRPTQSRSFWLQMVGRSLRISEGKPHAIILDHTDNYKRLGLPDDRYDWSLDSRIRPSSAFIPKPDGGGERRPKPPLEHLEGELVEIYSNSQELENNDMVKIRIDNVEYEVTRVLADVISKKLDRLNEVENLLTQQKDNVVNFQTSISNLEIELNEKHKEILKQEQVLQDLESKSNNYKIKLETALKKIIDITKNQNSSQKLTEEIDKLHQELTEKQKLLDIQIFCANKTEKLLKNANSSLNKLRENYKAREIDFNDTTQELANKQKLINELEKQIVKLKEKTDYYKIMSERMKENLDEIVKEKIESRLHTFIRASKLLEAYNITFEDVRITADTDAITAMKRVITKLNPKVDISDHSDEYVMNTFETYCEIVAKRIEYEKSIK